MQEVILHDPLLRSQVRKQEPDRVYGLQATKNFEELLSEPMCNATSKGSTIGENIKTSPFKESTEPLLFPFLILEAKAERSLNGFMDIQTQTMFPILALLKLQQDLQSTVDGSDRSDLNPLVWFFANRGDSWRLYGCYITDDEEPRYVSIPAIA